MRRWLSTWLERIGVLGEPPEARNYYWSMKQLFTK